MKRKTFIMTLVAPIIGLFAKVIAGATEISNQRTVLICNADGSTRKANFDELIYADYFEIVEPNGKIVPNGEPWLAITNVFKQGMDTLSIGVFNSECLNGSKIMEIVTPEPYNEYRMYKSIFN